MSELTREEDPRIKLLANRMRILVAGAFGVIPQVHAAYWVESARILLRELDTAKPRRKERKR